MNQSNLYLEQLKKIIPKKKHHLIFPCIQDFVSSPSLSERFPEGSNRPNRQEITQFLAKWFLYLDIKHDTCLNWMLPYCQEVLSFLSSSSPSQIRHSTKSNLRYIYQNMIPFECHCQENVLWADCSSECPVYQEMERKFKEQQNTLADQDYFQNPAIEIPEEEKVEPIKKKFEDQFEEAIAFAQEKLNRGGSKKRVAQLMNNKGYKTRTGKRWTSSILSNEINRLKKLNNDS